jgi:hypothetical protein
MTSPNNHETASPASEDVVERVARVLVEVDFGHLGDRMDEWMSRDDFARNYRALASAAIAAMDTRRENEGLRAALIEIEALCHSETRQRLLGICRAALTNTPSTLEGDR